MKLIQYLVIFRTEVKEIQHYKYFVTFFCQLMLTFLKLFIFGRQKQVKQRQLFWMS